MALPLGTTSRQIGAILRWMFTGIIVVGMVAWWYPGYRNWGAMLGAMLVGFCLWCMFRIVSQDRRIWGNPFYLVLFWPGLALVSHFVFDGLIKKPGGGFSGGMDLSLLLGFTVIGVAVLLSQSLMAQMSQKHISVISICGGAMMLGGLQGVFIPQADAVSGTMGLVGLSGAAVWFSALWMRSSVDDQVVFEVHRNRALERLCVIFGVLVTVAICVGMDKTVLPLVGLAVGFVLLVSGILYKRRKTSLLGLIMFLAGGGMLGVWRLFGQVGQVGIENWAGMGENGFSLVSKGSWSIFVIGSVAGWLVVCAMVLFALWSLGVMLGRSRRASIVDQNRTIAWACASSLSLGALFAPGGMFVPAVILAVGLSWGTLPAMTARGVRSYNGIIVLVIMLMLTLLFGISSNVGLLIWVVESFAVTDKPDKFLHGIIGLLLAMVLLWQMGTRRLWLGLLAIVIAIAAGGAGEIAQRIIGTRQLERADWMAHLTGSVIALVPYLLCIGSRLCESKDVELVDIDDDKYFE